MIIMQVNSKIPFSFENMTSIDMNTQIIKIKKSLQQKLMSTLNQQAFSRIFCRGSFIFKMTQQEF